MQIDILTKIKNKFIFLENITDCKIINNIVCVSCYINNNANYFILYPHGDIVYKYNDYWDYISKFNQDGFGNGIVFIDLQTLDIIKSFYYKDDLCMDWDISISYLSSSFIITEHEERTHIFFIDDFSVFSFGGTNYKVYENYILFFPYLEYSQYNTFCILDIQSKKRIDLHFILEDINLISKVQSDAQPNFFHWNENISDIEYSDFSIDCNQTYLQYKDISLYEIEALFKNKIQLKQVNNDKQNIYNIQKLENTCNGFALDIHTTKSVLMEDGSFDTIRSKIGELLYQIKYKYNNTLIPELSEIIAVKIKELFGMNIDVIVPIPPSNFNRPFQPVSEIAKCISERLSIPYDLKYLQKKPTLAIKSIDDDNERKKILKNAFFVENMNYKDKTILLFDDLYRSGSTIESAIKVLYEMGKVANILVLTITKTRTQR